MPLKDQYGKKKAREVIYYHKNPRKSASLQCPFNGMDIKAKRCESFDNEVFFDIEAKQTRSIVWKLILKQSEHVYIKEFKYRSEAK